MIYFDNSATTRVDDEVILEMNKYMNNFYFNIDSSYSNKIINEIDKKKEILKKKLGLNKNSFIFTSGGAEANRIALFGIMKKYKKGHFLISSIEHPSIIENALQLEKEGYELEYIKVDKYGNIDIENLKNLIREDTKLISIMGVNNEIGTIQNLNMISNLIKEKNSNTIFHTDFVQGLNHIDIDFSKVNVDLISISSHKIHGPKGIGALYVKEDLKLKELYFGENKYNRYMARTFPSELIVGFLKAIELSKKEEMEKIKDLKNYFITKLNLIENIKINSPLNSVDNIINVSFIGIRSEIMQNYLSFNDIYISKGSACSTNKKDSHVLRALNIDKQIVESSVRISFSKYNTKEEIDKFFEIVIPFIKEVRGIKI